MKSIFNRRGGISLILMLLSILFLVACEFETPVKSPQSEAVEKLAADYGLVEADPSSSTNLTRQIHDLALAPNNSGFTNGFLGNVAVVGDAETGISITGSGKVSASPNLAVLSLSVEAFAVSVAEARDEAAGSIDRVVNLLLVSGIAEKDIQTRHFNISPRYTSREITRCLGDNQSDCFKDRQGVIIGYQVTNQLSVQVRDLDSIGSLIDQATAAGGDLVRFQGVAFSIEDTQALEIEAREAAVADFMAKATQIANLTGLTLGKPVFIAEVNRSESKPFALADRAFKGMEAAVETPILTGVMDVVITLQARYDIK